MFCFSEVKSTVLSTIVFIKAILTYKSAGNIFKAFGGEKLQFPHD
jgi:hypothetical protein